MFSLEDWRLLLELETLLGGLRRNLLRFLILKNLNFLVTKTWVQSESGFTKYPGSGSMNMDPRDQLTSWDCFQEWMFPFPVCCPTLRRGRTSSLTLANTTRQPVHSNFYQFSVLDNE
jgi:hypothetical protein